MPGLIRKPVLEAHGLKAAGCRAVFGLRPMSGEGRMGGIQKRVDKREARA